MSKYLRRFINHINDLKWKNRVLVIESDEDIDFSRYSYFYSLYLFESGKISESKKKEDIKLLN